MNRKTKTLCEASIFIALALVLETISLYKLPNGGSVTLSAVPIVLSAVRSGCGWGAMAGFVFGGINYMMGGRAIDWATIICDYFLAFAMLGFGAGLFRKKRLGVVFGSLTVLFMLLAIGDFTGIHLIKNIAGFEGIFCGLSAIYSAMGQILNAEYGKDIIPLG